MKHSNLLFFPLLRLHEQLLNLFEVLLVYRLGGTVGDFLRVRPTQCLNVLAELIHLLLANLLHRFLHFEFVGLHLKLEIDLAHASIQLVNLGEEVLLATRCLFNFLLQVKHDH